MFEALVASIAVATCSLAGAVFFGAKLGGGRVERYVIPLAVGVFLSLALYELLPEVVLAAPEWGGLVIGLGFVGFYALAYLVHQHLHTHATEHNDKREAAILLMVGDAIHNFADGVVIGTAFLVSPPVGIAASLAIALHEIPQEIVEFGVLLRAGYRPLAAVLRNSLSASAVVVGTLTTLVLAAEANSYVWVLSALAAGNLLYIAATELLPRLHGSLNHYRSFWHVWVVILIGFLGMTAVIFFAHHQFENDSEQHRTYEEQVY
jgi:zinc and cadmium transporter